MPVTMVIVIKGKPKEIALLE